MFPTYNVCNSTNVFGEKGEEQKRAPQWVRTRHDVPRLFTNKTIGKVMLFIGNRRKQIDRKMRRRGPLVLANIDVHGHCLYLTNDAELAKFALDDRRCTKYIEPSDTLMWAAKEFLQDSLLTASTDSKQWQRARSFFTPLFSRTATDAHYGAMCEASMLFARAIDQTNGTLFNPLSLSVRATLHAILLALFSHRSDLFSTQSRDVALSEASSTFLEDSVKRAYYPKFLQRLVGSERWEWATELLSTWLQNAIDERRRTHEQGKRDILQSMIEQQDGEKDDAIVRQLALLIVAGHETTGSSISFLLEAVARRPNVQERVRQEALQAGFTADGQFPTSIDALSSLQYTERVIFESLRTNGPITGQLRQARRDVTVRASDGTQYAFREGDRISILNSSLHTNPRYWDAPHKFDPDRFTVEAKQTRHPYAFLPFSAGARGCLGRMFAMQEMKIFLCSIVVRHTLDAPLERTASENYGITMKPRRMALRVLPLADMRSPSSETIRVSVDTAAAKECPLATLVEQPKHVRGLSRSVNEGVLVAYGSNHGDAFQLAQQCKQELANVGFDVQIMTLNRLATLFTQEKLVKTVIVVTSTYNGEPPENAASFLPLTERSNQQHPFFYAVFGTGNSEWRATYQEFPRTVNYRLATLHGASIIKRGEGDVEMGLSAQWEPWLVTLKSILCNAVGRCPVAHGAAEREKSPNTTKIEWGHTNKAYQPALTNASIVNVCPMPKCASKIDVLVQLDTPRVVQPGDHLSLRPQNDLIVAQRCLDVFHVKLTDTLFVGQGDDRSVVHPDSLMQRLLERHEPTSLVDLFVHDVDLACSPTAPLLAFTEQKYSIVATECRNVAELVERTRVSSPAFADWIPFLSAIQPRKYSIANAISTPTKSIRLLVSVAPYGLSSNFLAQSQAADKVRLSVDVLPSLSRPTTNNKPIIMIAAGTGLAPFMSFIESRRRCCGKGGKLTLVYGSRTQDDCLCLDELKAFEHEKVLSHLFFARSQERRLNGVQRYTGDVIVQHARLFVSQIVEEGASVFICGAARTVANDARSALYKACALVYGATRADELLHELERDKRIVEDVWM